MGKRRKADECTEGVKEPKKRVRDEDMKGVISSVITKP
jgi:hypothetical protein